MTLRRVPDRKQESGKQPRLSRILRVDKMVGFSNRFGYGEISGRLGTDNA